MEEEPSSVVDLFSVNVGKWLLRKSFIQSLAQALYSNNSKLTKLDLEKHSMGEQEVKRICLALQNNSMVKKLDLSFISFFSFF